MVGGSEIAALLGWNYYCSFRQLLRDKSGGEERSPVGIACWWGTVFEPVSERLVEIDCGTTCIDGQSWKCRL